MLPAHLARSPSRRDAPMSPSVFQRYLSAARTVSRLAMGDVAAGPTVKTYSPSRFLIQDADRLSEDLPLGSRGGMAVRHRFPVDGKAISSGGEWSWAARWLSVSAS